RLAPRGVEGAERLDAAGMRVDALRVDARLQLVGGCCLEGDVGAYSGALLSVFQGHRTNSVVLPIRRRQEESLNAGEQPAVHDPPPRHRTQDRTSTRLNYRHT